jgi:PAS domain-containing protein
MTVYGRGEQRKPFISLTDAVEGLVQLATTDPDDRDDDEDGVLVYNQVTRPISIVELATTIAGVADEFDLDVDVKHFDHPREEDVRPDQQHEPEKSIAQRDPERAEPVPAELRRRPPRNERYHCDPYNERAPEANSFSRHSHVSRRPDRGARVASRYLYRPVTNSAGNERIGARRRGVRGEVRRVQENPL